jgi:hypothetical protein
MSVSLPQGSNVSLPDVPSDIKTKYPEVHRYLVDIRRTLMQSMNGLVDNDSALQSAVNSGASGTYVTSGKSFVFVNGIFTSTL